MYNGLGQETKNGRRDSIKRSVGTILHIIYYLYTFCCPKLPEKTKTKQKQNKTKTKTKNKKTKTIVGIFLYQLKEDILIYIMAVNLGIFDLPY